MVKHSNIICRLTVVINVTITQQESCGTPTLTEKFGLMFEKVKLRIAVVSCIYALDRKRITVQNVSDSHVLVCLLCCLCVCGINSNEEEEEKEQEKKR